MKFLRFSLFAALIFSTTLFSGCGEEDPATVSPFTGNYVISKATLAEALVIPIVPFNGMDAITVPVGYDITTAIQSSLLSQVSCSSADKSWVELREDKSIYMSCEGANELNAGTWEEVSSTELNLNMNHAAIPSSESGFLLTVTNIVQTDNTMSGKTSVPLPKEMIAGMIAPLTLAASAPSVIMVTFTLDFVEK